MNDRWLDHALRLLAERGHRTGDARSTIVERLAREGGCLTAEEVDRLRGDGRRVGTASVYRALGLLTDLGLLQRAALGDGPVRYDLVDADAGHHHHLVCGRCGQTATFEDPRLGEAIEGAAQDVDRTFRCCSASSPRGQDPLAAGHGPLVGAGSRAWLAVGN